MSTINIYGDLKPKKKERKLPREVSPGPEQYLPPSPRPNTRPTATGGYQKILGGTPTASQHAKSDKYSR